MNALQEKYDQQTLQIESLEGEKCKLEISNSKLTTEVHDLNINIKNYQVQIEKSDKEKKSGDVVDAEFEEVKEEKNSDK